MDAKGIPGGQTSRGDVVSPISSSPAPHWLIVPRQTVRANYNSDFTLSVTPRDSVGRHASRGVSGTAYLWLPATFLAKHLGLEEVDLRGPRRAVRRVGGVLPLLRGAVAALDMKSSIGSTGSQKRAIS